MSQFPHTVPKEGFIGTGVTSETYHKITSTDHNVASIGQFQLGQKIRYYNSALAGWGTCIYLQYVDVEGGVTEVECMPVTIDDTSAGRYVVTGDVGEAGAGSSTAMSLSAMTATYYGWFWCGGTCPDFLVDGGATAYSASTVLVGTSVTTGDNFQFDADLNITLGTNDATIAKMGYAIATTGATSSAMSNLVLFDNWP